MVAQSTPSHLVPQPLNEMFKANRKNLMSAVISGMDRDRFIRTAWVALQTNKDLADCEEASVVKALIQCAQMGLYPDGINGYAYLVAFKSKHHKRKICTVIRGYKGLIRLFAANPDAARMPIVCEFVQENDHFSWGLGANPFLEHRPAPSDERGPQTHVYSVFRFADGSVYPKVMTIDEAMAYKRFARSTKFWDDHPQWMMKKTCIRQNAKLVPLAETTERQQVIEDALEAGDEETLEKAVFAEEVAQAAELELGPGIQEPVAVDEDAIEAPACAKCGRHFEEADLMDGVCSACIDKIEQGEPQP